MTEIDHEFTREVVCPWCGYEHNDSWDRSMSDGDCNEDDCGKCGKPFTVSCIVTVEYSTEKDHARDATSPVTSEGTDAS